METAEKIRNELLSLSDEKYRKFLAPLVPGCDPECIIGVRSPQLRQLARTYKNDADISGFLSDLPHRYHEETLLHAFIISEIRDLSDVEAEVDRLLPFVENWAVCDSLSPKAYKKHRTELMPKILERLGSAHTYTVRFAIKELMQHFLDECFEPCQLDIVAGVISPKYYINMMRAWYFATALAKQWDSALTVLTAHKLDKWTHNKTIQKAIESYRITYEQKEYLRSLKI